MKPETMAETEVRRAEARLPRWMMALAALATVAALLAGQPRFAAEFVLGAGLALVNYFWLHQAIEHLMWGGEGRVPRALVAKFALRYPLAFGGVYLLYRTEWVSLPGLFAGLRWKVREALPSASGKVVAPHAPCVADSPASPWRGFGTTQVPKFNHFRHFSSL